MKKRQILVVLLIFLAGSIGLYIKWYGYDILPEIHTVLANREQLIGSSSDFALLFPKDALSKDARIKIYESVPRSIKNELNNAGLEVVGKVYSISVDSLELSKKVKIIVRLNEEYSEGVYQIIHRSQGVYSFLETSYVNGSLVAETQSFSDFAVVKRLFFKSENETQINSQKNYLAKIINQNGARIYEDPFNRIDRDDGLFSFVDQKVVDSLPYNSEVRAVVGGRIGITRQILDDSGNIGYVLEEDLEIIGNEKSVLKGRTRWIIPVKPDDIFLEGLKLYKKRVKNQLSENISAVVKFTKDSGRNFMLVEIESKGSNQIVSYESAFGILVPPDSGILVNDIEVNYIDQNGLYLDAHELDTNIKFDIHEVLVDFLGSRTVGVPIVDQVEKYAKKIY
jgi:hypothetical protein